MPTSTGAEPAASSCEVLDGSRHHARAAAELGGKAAWTDRLIAAGLPVPPAAVVDADVYRWVARDPGVAALVRRIRDGEDVPADVVDRAFLDAEVPPALRERITAVVARVAGDGGRLAVRSSATVEDLAETSFAGQYRTLLELTPGPEVLDAVRLVWASLWHPAPVAYRRAHAVADDDVAMAVLIMRMIDATQAGVVFTVDPGGRPGALRVEAVEGLGEALVSGAATPSAWVVPRASIGDAGLPPGARLAADLALRVEEAIGAPADVEWAAAPDGGVWIVQARPITVAATAGDGFDTAVDDAELTTAGIAEMLPGVLPPLTWEVAGFMVEEALRRSLDDLGLLDPDLAAPHAMIRRVRGRAALDLDSLKRVADRLPGVGTDEVEEQYFGREAPDPDGSAAAPDTGRAGGRLPLRLRLRRMRHDLLASGVRRRAVPEAAVVIRAADGLARRAPPLDDLDEADLLAYRRRLLDVTARAMAAELAVAAAAAGAFRRLEVSIGAHLPTTDAARWAQRVTTGIHVATPPATASMSVVSGVTWAEVGTPPPSPHRTASGPVPGAGALAELEQLLRSLPGWGVRRVLTGQVVDVRIHVLRRFVAEARQLLEGREEAKVAVLTLGGQVRRVHRELARRWVDDGRLTGVRDVDLLADAELRGERPPPSPAELGRRRRWLARWEEDGPLPVRFRGVPAPDRPPVPDGAQLRGVGASGGRFTGRARVVRSPARGALRAGEVLVATSTDAAWTPLFLVAGAIVVERGGPLSHAAIVARELGVPAVLDVAGATARLDGCMVVVDGDAGVVGVLEEDQR